MTHLWRGGREKGGEGRRKRRRGGKKEKEEGREEERKEKGEEGKEYEKLFGVFSIAGVEFSTIMFPAYLHTFHKGCKQREFCGLPPSRGQ